MTLWLTIAGMGIVTFLPRVLPFLLVERFEMPGRVRQALSYVPMAVLSAIVAQDLVAPGGETDLSADNLRLLAGVAGVAVAALSRNIAVTIVAGMAVLWLLQWAF